MHIIQRIIKALFAPPDDGHYWRRYVAPTITRLRGYGVSDSDIEHLWVTALNTPDPTIVGQAPGSRFRDMADDIERGATVDDVLQRFANG